MLWLLLALSVATSLYACMVGSYPIPTGRLLSAMLHPLGGHLGLPEASPEQFQIVRDLRMPRTALGFMVGASLATAGGALQGLFRNPLADPGLIGVTAGGAIGAGVFIVFGQLWIPPDAIQTHTYAIMLGSMVGAITCTFAIYRLSQVGGRIHVPTMLLCGIAINAFAGAVIGLFIYLADLEALRDLTFWSLGSLSRAPKNAVYLALPVVAILILAIVSQGRWLNLLLLGEAEAGHLGMHTTRVKQILIACCGAAVGIAVALCGAIGFVGLVVPHLIRLLIGPDHRGLLPASALGGGCLMLLADALSRQASPAAELPIGIISAFIGAPFFLFLLLSAKRRELS